MIKRSFFNKLLAGAVLVGTLAACQGEGDFLEPKPVDLLSDDIAIQDAGSAEGAILGAYSSLQADESYGWMYNAFADLAVDGAYHSGSFPTYREIDVNQIFATNINVQEVWERGYILIYRTNIVLERVPGLSDEAMSLADKDRVMGEAYFLRALAHFDLMRYYGDIPLVTVTDVETNRFPSRAPMSDVYAQVLSDLAEAETLLANFNPGDLSQAKSRASVDAARALRARVALYQGDYATAANAASAVIDGGSYSLESSYDNLFEPANTTSSEVILQVYADANDGNSLAFWTNPSSAGGRWEIAPAPDFVFALEDSRDQGDSRYSALLAPHPTEFGEYYFTKFRDLNTGSDQPKLLRLAEQYLIRAEARAMQGDLSGAASDLNMVRSRAGLSNATFADQNDAIDQIMNERFIELVLEGHRYFDLRRTNKIDEVMNLINPDGWDSGVDQLFPIPQRDILFNTNLTQNPGY